MEGDPAGVAVLQTFCATASKSKGAMLKSVIDSCLRSPNVFVFSEMLVLENVQQLQGDESLRSSYNDLELFAFGNYQDYKNATPGTYSVLKPESILKLKKLTLIQLGSRSQILNYDDLLTNLDIDTVRELEDLFIACIYQGVIRGKIDQQNRRFHVDFVIARDIRIQDVSSLLNTISAWSSQTETLIRSISDQIQNIQSERERDRLQKQEVADRVLIIKESLKQDDFDMDIVAAGAGGEFLGRRPKKGSRRQGKGRMDDFGFGIGLGLDRRKM